VARVSPPVTLIDPLTLIGATQKLPRGGDVVVAYRNDNEFTIAEAQVFTQTLAATYSDYRFTLQATIAYTKEADFAQQATQILRHQPDLIMIAGLPKDGGTLVFELRQQQYDSYIIGGNGFNTSQIFEVCEECSKILLAQAFDSRLEKASNMRRQFIERYQQRYPERPSPIAAQMFSAIQVLVEALTELNQATPVTVATPLNELRDGINRRLLSGKPFVDTPLGAIAFAPNGEILQEQFYLAETKADAQGRWYFDTFATRENEALDVLRTAPTDCPDGYLP
jgi:branched-chain amino acid transport system substrate-binding protein